MSTLVRYPVPAARQDPGVGLSRIITPLVAGELPPSGLVQLVQENDGNVGATRQSSVTVTLPGNLAAGNYVTVELGSNNIPTWTLPDGTWTSIIRVVQGTSHHVEAFRHQVQAGEVGAAGSWVFTTADASLRSICWHVTEWSGVDLTTPVDGTPTSVTGTAGASIAVPAITVSDGAAAVVATSWSSGAGAFVTYTEPTGFTELVDQHTAINPAATDNSQHVSWETFPTAGSTGTMTITASGSSSHTAIGYALKAAPAGGPTPIGQAVETDIAQPITAIGGNPFPTTIGGIHPESNNRMGPLIDANGNLYTVTELSAADPRPTMRKSSNGGVTWAEVDGANRPAHDDLESSWLEQRGTVLYLLFQRSGTMRITHCTFNTSDAGASPDTWQLKDEVVHLPTTAPANQAVSLAVRSNGDLLAFYRTDPVSTFQRLAWRKKPSGGSWSSETQVDTTASTNFTQVAVVVGASDKIHIFYKDDTNSNVLHKSLTSADVLSASEVVNDNATTTDDQMMATPPVYVDVAGTERIYAAWKRLSTGFLVGAAIENDGTPLAEEVISDVAVWEDPAPVISEQSVAALAADTAADKIYALYSDNATHDLFRVTRNGTWGANSEVLDAVEVQYVAATVFTHGTQGQSKRVLGIIFDDNPTGAADAGVPKYTQITLGPPPLGQPTETDIGQPVGRLKTHATGQVTETDISQPIARVKTRAIGQITETNTSQPITRAKILATGQVTETDVVQAIARVKSRTVGQAVEIDVAQIITSFQPGVVVLSAPVPYNMAAPLGIVTLGQAVETDTAQPIARIKARALGQVTETDTAQAVSRQKVRVAQQTTETDIAQVIIAGVRTGTQLHLTTIAAESGVTVGAGTRHRFHWDAGASSTIRNKNTVVGPTAPLQITDSSTPGTDGAVVSWYSNQLETVTIAGAITIELWAEESGG